MIAFLSVDFKYQANGKVGLCYMLYTVKDLAASQEQLTWGHEIVPKCEHIEGFKVCDAEVIFNKFFKVCEGLDIDTIVVETERVKKVLTKLIKFPDGVELKALEGFSREYNDNGLGDVFKLSLQHYDMIEFYENTLEE